MRVGAHEVVAHAVHVGAVHLARHLAVREDTGAARRDDQRPVAVGAAARRSPSHSRRVEPLRPAWASWMPILRRAVACTKSTMRFQARDVLGLVHAGAAGRDAALAADVGHLGDHQPGAADRAAAEVHEVPVVGRAVLGRVLAHRRDDDAVREHEVAQAERREHRRRRRLGRRRVTPALVARASLGEPRGRRASTKRRVAHASGCRG